MSTRNERKIPKHWLGCPRKGTGLVGDLFMPLKTPLSGDYDKLVAPADKFSPEMMFQICKAKQIKLGLWVDLTNVHQFYNKEEIEAQGCTYKYLRCGRHQGIPSRKKTNEFIELVDGFLRQYPLEKIAVHCTYGFNQTGFFIVSYLMERMQFNLEVAIEAFAKIRAPGIYKTAYFEKLFERYEPLHKISDDVMYPSWHSKDNEDSEEEESTSSGSSSEYGFKGVHFLKGVCGVIHSTDRSEIKRVQKTVLGMCKWPANFPGCQGVPLNAHNMSLLHEKTYRVSWQTDGVRYLLLINEKYDIYLVDQNFNVFEIFNLRFPSKKDPKQHLTKTLLDGEMVVDMIDGKARPRFLINDIIKLNDQDVGKTPFYPSRYFSIKDEIIEPRRLAANKGLINKKLEAFSVRCKSFYNLTKTARLLENKFKESLTHEMEGLIFYPFNNPYVPGLCTEVLKWKPMEKICIFRLNIRILKSQGVLPRQIYLLYVNGLEGPFAEMKYTPSLQDLPLDDKIVECQFVKDQWIFKRQRFDKLVPDSYAFVKTTCEQEGVLQERLLDFIKETHNDNTISSP